MLVDPVRHEGRADPVAPPRLRRASRRARRPRCSSRRARRGRRRSSRWGRVEMQPAHLRVGPRVGGRGRRTRRTRRSRRRATPGAGRGGRRCGGGSAGSARRRRPGRRAAAARRATRRRACRAMRAAKASSASMPSLAADLRVCRPSRSGTSRRRSGARPGRRRAAGAGSRSAGTGRHGGGHTCSPSISTCRAWGCPGSRPVTRHEGVVVARDLERARRRAEHGDGGGSRSICTQTCAVVSPTWRRTGPRTSDTRLTLLIGLRCAGLAVGVLQGQQRRRRSSRRRRRTRRARSAARRGRRARRRTRAAAIGPARAAGPRCWTSPPPMTTASSSKIVGQRRDADAEPAAEAVEDVLRRRVALLGGAGPRVPGDAAVLARPSRAMSAVRIVRGGLAPHPATARVPDATASKQPWLPQPQRGPSGLTVMWPSSAPMPVGPR